MSGQNLIVVRMNEGRFPKRDKAVKLSRYREKAQTKMDKRCNMKLSRAVGRLAMQLPRGWRDNHHVIFVGCMIILVVLFSMPSYLSNGRAERSETRIIPVIQSINWYACVEV